MDWTEADAKGQPQQENKEIVDTLNKVRNPYSNLILYYTNSIIGPATSNLREQKLYQQRALPESPDKGAKNCSNTRC